MAHGERNANCERTSLSGHAFHIEAAAMRFDDMSNQGKPEPVPRSRGSPESARDKTFQKCETALFSDTDPSIGNLNQRLTILRGQP